MSMSTRGRMTSIGMAQIELAADEIARRGDDVGDLRHGGLLELGIVGDRRFGAAEPHDRRVEIVEGLALGDAWR